MRKIVRKISAVTLVFAFGLFNIGLPVVLYLCPMMNSFPAECPMMSDGPSDGLAFVNQNPSCCGKFIVAERNIIPFVKAQELQLEKAVALAPVALQTPHDGFIATQLVPVESFRSNSPHIFLLNSTLLI